MSTAHNPVTVSRVKPFPPRENAARGNANPKSPARTLTLKGVLHFIRADNREGLKSLSPGTKVKVMWHQFLGSGSAHMREMGTDWTTTIKPEEGRRIFKNWPVEWAGREENPSRAFGGDIHSQLSHAVTEYDRKESTKKYYNHYALALYLKAVQDTMAEVNSGTPVRKALTHNFNGRLLNVVLKAVGEAGATKEEQRFNKRGNPAGAADEMHESFHGMPPSETLAYDDRIHVHTHLTGLGTLVGLKIRTVNGRDIAVYFEKPSGEKSNPRDIYNTGNYSEKAQEWAASGARLSVGGQVTKGIGQSTVTIKKLGREKWLLSQSYSKQTSLVTDRSILIGEMEYFLDAQHLAEDAKELFGWLRRTGKIEPQQGNPSLSHYLAGKAAGMTTSNFLPFKTVATETAAYDLQGKLARSGVGSRIDRVRTRLLPTPRYKYEVMVDREDYKAHATRHKNSKSPSPFKLPRSKGGKGVFKPAVKTVGKMTDAVYEPGREIVKTVAGALDKGLKLNAHGEPTFRKGSSMWRASGGGEYPTKTEAIKAALSYGRERGVETVQIFRNGKAILFNVATGRPMYEQKTNPHTGSAQLATNEKGTQLFIQGGDQSMDLASIKITGPEATKENVLVGEVWLINYYTTKVFDGEEETAEYIHGFGPESAHVKLRKNDDLWKDAVPPEKLFGTGELPTLIYRPLEQRLVFAGGVYKIDKPLLGTSPGIEN